MSAELIAHLKKDVFISRQRKMMQQKVDESKIWWIMWMKMSPASRSEVEEEPGYEAALKSVGAKFAVYQYPGTQHGFNNDTTPRYDAAAAKLAWERTVAFLKAWLQGDSASA